MWDIPDGRAVGTVKLADSCNALAFSPDGRTLAVGDIIYGGATPVGKIMLTPV